MEDSGLFSCPSCFKRQRLYDALSAPAPGPRGTLLACAGCGTAAVMYAESRAVDMLLRTTAQLRVERRVREWREQLDAEVVPSWLT